MGKLTPWVLGSQYNSPADREGKTYLNIHGDHRLGGRLGLALLLLLVLSEAALTLSDDLSVFLLVVGAEQVNLIVVLGSLLGVLGHGHSIGAIGGESLGRVTGKAGELGLVGLDVVVPAVGVGVVLNGGLLGDGLEGDDIGLGRSIAVTISY